jgi:hypothetical protein
MVEARHYVPAVAEAATVVAISESAHADRYGRLDQIVDRLAMWGARIGEGARAEYCATTARHLALEGFGPDGWLVRKVTTAVDAAVWANSGRGMEIAGVLSRSEALWLGPIAPAQESKWPESGSLK